MEDGKLPPGLKLNHVLFGTSLILNIYFVSQLALSNGTERGWSRRAAAEAEAVAALSCSGHGRAYLDGVLVDGTPSCECNTCYVGPDCSELLPDCAADVDRMERPKVYLGVKLLLLFNASIFLNIFFISYLFLSRRPDLGWTLRAAAEAEAAAVLSCSGHGRAFLDGFITKEELLCECNACYGGPDCSILLPNCAADADGGDPIFLEPYWREHAAASAVVVAGWHRMSYSTTGDNFISVELEKHLRLFHRAVGNAVTDGRYIVFGAGSTQLLNALVHALSPDNSSSLARVVASIPNYTGYKVQTDLFDSKEYEWAGVTSNWANKSYISARGFIEFVTSPNNPDGLLKKAVLGGSSAIYDHAYYWPHFTAIPAPADEDVMLFSMSKVSGHASSRFGWALIKDEEVYQKVTRYMLLNTMGASRDTQLRVLKLIKVILTEIKGGGDIFGFGHKTMRERWLKLNSIVSASNRFSFQQLSPQYCTYFRKIRDPSPAYGWLKCERVEDKDCYAVLKAAGIISRTGTVFEADSRHTRLSLIKTQDDFDLLVQRMKALVSEEGLSSF